MDVPSVPTDTNRIWFSRERAVAVPKAALDLVYCNACGHVFNSTYDDALVDYEADYENSQMFSPRFRKYCEEFSDKLIAKYDLHNKHILEIGGGKGDFLRIICGRGNNVGVSFDPGYKPEPGDDIPKNIRFIADYYPGKYANEVADLIICRHVLEHLWDPKAIITALRSAVGGRRDLPVCFEVPNGDYIFRERAFWEFHYQHCSYFTKTSLTKLFTECGFEVRDIQENFDGQFLTVLAFAPAHDVAARGNALNGELSRTEASGDALGAALRARVDFWRNHLEELRTEGKRVVAWGAGAKAVTFLNLIGTPNSVITHVVDVNPRKIGHFIPGAGQEVVAEGALQQLRPDEIIVMNGAYKDEIGAALHERGLNPVLSVV